MMGDKTKHLVRVGHEFAAAMSDDTPIITIAKMVTELASALDVQSARSDALAAELARYSMPAGEADQRMAESRAVRQALGFGQDADDVAPVDLVERINALAAALKASETNDADARCHVAELEEKCAALAAKLSDVCAENAALREYRPQPSGAAMMEALDAFYEYHEDVPEHGMMAAFEILCCKRPETPTTDAWVKEQRAAGRVEGVNFAAARLAAAFNHGFIDKPTAEVYDVVKAVLGAKEELGTAPDDGLSGEYAEQALNDWAAQLRGSQV